MPIKYWVGINQVFLLPNFWEKIESTMGAQKSFNENGHCTKLNSACVNNC